MSAAACHVVARELRLKRTTWELDGGVSTARILRATGFVRCTVWRCLWCLKRGMSIDFGAEADCAERRTNWSSGAGVSWRKTLNL